MAHDQAVSKRVRSLCDLWVARGSSARPWFGPSPMATKARRHQMRPELPSFLRCVREHPSAGQVAQAYALPGAQAWRRALPVSANSLCVSGLCVCVCPVCEKNPG